MIEIGPLEYIVLGFEDRQLADSVFQELDRFQASGLIQVRDLLFVRKDALGSVSIQEVGDLEEEDLIAYNGLVDGLTGLLTQEDIERLASKIPPGTLAVIVLFEHRWTLQLADAVHEAGGVLFTGGMISHEAWRQVNTELLAKEENHA